MAEAAVVVVAPLGVVGAGDGATAAEVTTTANDIAKDSGKVVEEYRNYSDNMQTSIVYNHYKQMRTNQCAAFTERMMKKWTSFDHAKLTVKEAFDKLEGYVDSSDPDITLPNVIHALQTAEAIRAAGEPEWMVLTGLLHDMGKIMFVWGEASDGQEGTRTGPQWALGGDTWVVGVDIPDSAVFPEFNKLNPDYGKAEFKAPLGRYTKGCGLKNLQFAFGHDEYMYQMLLHNKTSLPKEALAIVRYHSCYPMHTHDEYKELLEDGDKELLEWVVRFNKYDLYTKCETEPSFDKLWPYYQGLIDKYLPGTLDW